MFYLSLSSHSMCSRIVFVSKTAALQKILSVTKRIINNVISGVTVGIPLLCTFFVIETFFFFASKLRTESIVLHCMYFLYSQELKKKI